MSEPYSLQLKVIKRILRYIKGIVNFSIHYFPSKEVEQVDFNYSNWGNNLDDKKSTSCNGFSLASTLIT